jgi:replicative DNA helicase
LSALKYEVSSFDAGLFLSNVDQFLGKLHEDIETMPTGIVELDRVQSGPARAELHVFLAPTNRGKSWWLMHLAKHALMQRFRVLHVSLEMSIQRCAIRYVQTLFSISKREAEVRVPELEVENNTVAAIGYRTMKRPTLNDPDIRPLIAGKMKKMGRRLKLVIQEFATGSLTITGLQVYLDRLERMHKFVPDLILVDYADNMKLNTDNYRLDLGALYKNLRRIAVERNCAVATASQSNRAGEDARFITLKHLGEDYSKAQTADVVISYNQTQQERELGLARLFVAKSRNDEAGGTVLIAQGYAVGQFCVQSSMISPARYWDLVDGFSGKKDTDDED